MAQESPNRIVELREKLGMTAKGLAEKLGVNRSTVGRLESGKRKLTKEWMERIAQALGVSPTDLLVQDKTVVHVPVIGRVSTSRAPGRTFYAVEESYSMPFPAARVMDKQYKWTKAFANAEMVAFETQDNRGWVFTFPVDKLSAANYIERQFIVRKKYDDGWSEFSLRTLERGKDALYLIANDVDPSLHAFRLDLPAVQGLWIVAWTLKSQ